MRGKNLDVYEGYFGMVVRGKKEGCLTTELQHAGNRDGPHNAKQLFTGRHCQYYIMYTKFNIMYTINARCRRFFSEMVAFFEFFPGF